MSRENVEIVRRAWETWERGDLTIWSHEADDGPRTRDLRLGKPTLYQLSYVRARMRF